MSQPDEAQLELEGWVAQHRNWGRWGDGDEKGAANLADPRKRISALRMVQRGWAISLSRPISLEPNIDELFSPVRHFVRRLADVGVDYVEMPIHHGTHLDALNHMVGAERSWNGRHPEVVGPVEPAPRGGVDAFSEGIITRGLLFDVPKFREVPYVDVTAPVTQHELVEIADRQGLAPEPGDALVIYTGHDRYLDEYPAYRNWGGTANCDDLARMPGIDPSCLKFVQSADPSLVMWDMLDKTSGRHAGGIGIHAALWALGVPVVHGAQLDRLVDACTSLERSEFALVIAPLRLPGATGSPVNPLALL